MSSAVAPAPAPAAAAPAEVARARIAVMVATYQVDVVVPTKFTIETFIDDLLGVLATAIDDEEVDFTPPSGQWSLARPGDHPIPRWRSLADHDVVDGTVLMLAPVDSAEVFTPVVEDITDALALINDREFAEFDPDIAAVVGLIALGVGAVAVAAMLSWSWMRTGSIGWCGVPALVLGLLCWCGAVAVRRRASAPRIGFGLAMSALPLLFAGGAMLVPPAFGRPGPFAAANLAAGAVVVVAGAAVMLRLTRVGAASLTAVLILGVAVTASILPAAYLDISVRQVAAGAAFVGVLLLAGAPRLAVVAARIRPPDLPDPGNEVSPATLTDIFDAETARAETSEHDPADPDENQPAQMGIEARARLAVTTLRGLVVAGAGLLSVATVVSAAASPGGVREIVLAAAVTGMLVMRSRWHPDRVQAVSLVIAAGVTVAGTGFGLGDTDASAPARLSGALVVAAATVAGCVAAAQLPGRRLSPVARRVIDLVEYALILVVPVLTFWIMGVYTAARRI